MVGVTVSHELVHALQDQYFNLDSLGKVQGRNDRQVAAQAVVEGQATIEQLSAMLGSGAMLSNIPGGWDRVRETIRDAQNTMPVFAGAPMIIQETLLFPYLSGAEFMKNFKDRSEGKLPFEDMPVSTEQVMHDDRFFVTRDAPTPVTLPAPAGGEDVYENELWEFESAAVPVPAPQVIVTPPTRGCRVGWGPLRVVHDAGGDGLAWATVWGYPRSTLPSSSTSSIRRS
jgi:hypothetical protein